MSNRWLGPGIMLLATLIGLLAYPELPDEIATHWGISGDPDDWTRKSVAVAIMPAIALVTWIVLILAPRIDPRRENFEAFADTYYWIVNGTMIFLAALHLLVIANGLGWDIPLSRAMLVGLGLLFVLIGVAMRRFKSNWVAGIRTPWTLSDEEVWTRTHERGAAVFVISGLATIIGALLLPIAVATIVSLLLILGGSIWVVVYSYVLYRDRDTAG